MPARLIPDSEVDQLMRQGLTDREIADFLYKEHNISVTPNAIVAWRRRHGKKPKRPRYNDLLPWRVREEHIYDYIPRLLRFEARMRQGLPVAPKDQANVRLFKQKLDGAFPGGGVVHYDPDTEQGWWVVERRPGIDTDLIRNPEVP